MKTKDIVTYALIAGGAYALYWYVTNYGPNGPVSATNPSWWSTWFGGTAGTGTTAATTTTTTTGTTATTTTTNPGVTAAPTTIVDQGGVSTDQLLAAASLPATGKLSASQWNWYYSKVSGVTQDKVSLGDNGSPMDVFTYMTMRQQKGYTTPASGSSSVAATSATAANFVPPSTTAGAGATQNQIAQIIALLNPSDVPKFQAMVAAGLTYDQANAMLANAQGCQNASNAIKIASAQVPGAPVPPTLAYSPTDATSGSCVPSGMSGIVPVASRPNAQPAQGMGAITPTQSVRPSTGSPSRSPWGRIPALDAGGMKFKN
jgi:hypothetical protein